MKGTLSILGTAERLYNVNDNRARVDVQSRPPDDPARNPKQHGVITMRFMMMVKADKNSEAGIPPSPELMTKMCKFFEEMTKAGVLLASEGLQPSSKGFRIKAAGGKLT